MKRYIEAFKDYEKLKSFLTDSINKKFNLKLKDRFDIRDMSLEWNTGKRNYITIIDNISKLSDSEILSKTIEFLKNRKIIK